MEEDIPLLPSVPPLEAIYGDRAYLCPKLSFVPRGWNRGDRWYGDMLTGRFATAPGNAPRLVAAAAVTPSVARWFGLAGLPLHEDCDRYADQADHTEHLRAAIARGLRIAGQFPLHEDHWAFPHALNAADLLIRLADKRSISEFVPEPFCPRREVFEGPDFVSGKVRPPTPCVVKISSRFAATAGRGVQVCLAPEDVEFARNEFGAAERIVVEEWLPFERTFCFHGAAYGDGRAALLGVTEQIIVHRSRYGGGWYGPGVDPPETAWRAARAVLRRIAATGLQSIVGIDLGVLPDGSVRAFDINPRINASTSGLWMADFRHEFRTMHGCMHAWRTGLSWEQASALIEPQIRAGRWLPLAVRDPAPTLAQGPGPMLLGVTLGPSRAEAIAAAEDLRARLGAEVP
ncbi:MAG: ATP-grasp domain-containing protein [Verrucomicrobiae bacterium]|nr:ATP-grasp domain-containing protein [Verrucomicrobiae bacterium]